MSSYINHEAHPFLGWKEHSYDEQAVDRLIWLYGYERARAIRLGQDQPTNDDIAAWDFLGKRTPGDKGHVNPFVIRQSGEGCQ